MKNSFDSCYVKLPTAYFRKIERMIGSDRLGGNVAIIIWKDEIPVRILAVVNGDLKEADAARKFPLMNTFQVMNLIEKVKGKESISVFDLVVQGDGFSYYDE